MIFFFAKICGKDLTFNFDEKWSLKANVLQCLCVCVVTHWNKLLKVVSSVKLSKIFYDNNH